MQNGVESLIERLRAFIDTDSAFQTTLKPGNRWTIVFVRPNSIRLKNEAREPGTVIEPHKRKVTLRYPTPAEWNKIFSLFPRISRKRATLEFLRQSQPRTRREIREVIGTGRGAMVTLLNRRLKIMGFNARVQTRTNPRSTAAYQQLVEVVMVE